MSRAASPGDAELVARAVDADRWARGELYHRHAADLAATLTRLLRNADDALDVLHDTYVYAFAKLASLREPERFRAWLYRIAINYARTRLRRAKLAALLGLAPCADASWEALATTASPERRAELAQIERCLSRIAVDDRIVWVLRHVEGFALPEIATQVGCSLSTAKRRLRAAEARIAEAIGSEPT